MTEPQQGARYAELLAVAQAAEALGFDAFFRSDHYVSIPHVTPGTGDPGPTDSWLTLAALARETSVIRLGTMVSSATFRLPGPLAISVAQVDDMSRGRVELGLGAGWFEREHTGYGIPFPPVGERFDRLEEQLAVVTGLWATPLGETFGFEGRHYTLHDAPALPKPVQDPVPVIVGGVGPRRTPALAAQFASEYNVPFRSLAETGAAFERVRAACRAAGRSPETMTFSAAQLLCCGRSSQEYARRAAALRRDPNRLRIDALAGSPDEVIAKARQFAALGAARLYLQVLDLADLDHLELVAEAVGPALRD